MAQHDMPRMGSGTSWLPPSAPVSMHHLPLGDWSLMVDGAAFGMFDRQWTLHGDERWTVLDWEMATLARSLGGGLLRVNAMTSLESFFMPDTGYPQLLQSGETFAGRRIANTQHPHTLVGELAMVYDHSVTSTFSTSFYAAAVGEPALGPVAYRHRSSANADPFAPLGQHWLDESHSSRGVVTAGLYTARLRVEGSAFNGRQPDVARRELDFSGARLDSYAGRVTALPSEWIAVSAWAGYLAHHDPLDPVTGMQRYGVSVITENTGIRGGAWSTTFAWGVNNHHHGARAHDHDATKPMANMLSSGVLLESTLGIGTRTEVFARVEQVQKMADDLGFLGGNLMEMFNVRSIAAGAVREVAHSYGASFGIGARGALNLLPQTLRYTYTTTHPAGFAVFARIRPY